MNRKGWLLGDEASQNKQCSQADEAQSVKGRDHQTVSNPNKCGAKDDQPSRDQVSGVVLNRVDGTHSYINGRGTTTLDTQHALIQMNVHPFR